MTLDVKQYENICSYNVVTSPSYIYNIVIIENHHFHHYCFFSVLREKIQQQGKCLSNFLLSVPPWM